jgi:4-amino-4-deoxy-L-arabinose transferase-like glycosyltransferase
MRREQLPLFVLLLLLAGQGVLLFLRPLTPYGGDEPYYVEKAQQFRAHSRFDPASAHELALERGELWGTSDYRPPGYPLLLAAVSGGHFEPQVLRGRMRALQFLAIAAAIVAAYLLAARGTTPRRRYLLALLAGIAPWPFEYAGSILPDALTAALAFAGVVVLARAVRTRGAVTMFAGALLLATTFLLRPEIIVLVPLLAGGALLLSGFTWKRAAACALGMLLPAALHYAYRIQFTGERVPTYFAGFHTQSLGAMQWANTWVGSEHDLYASVVYAIAEGRPPVYQQRFLADPRERAELERAAALVRRDGHNSAEVDGIFDALRRRREHEHPFQAWLLPRVAHVGQLWINLETNDQLLGLLSNVPRSVRRPLFGLLLAVKLTVLALFCRLLAVVVLQRRDPDWVLWTLLAAFVLLRTLTVAGLHNTMEHRYVLAAWPAMLACALKGATPARPRSPAPVPPA